MLSYAVPANNAMENNSVKTHSNMSTVGGLTVGPTTRGSRGCEAASPTSLISSPGTGSTTSAGVHSLPNHCSNNNLINTMKHSHPLKRVSFGSSKGSMVETLIYDHPLPEEEISGYFRANIQRFGNNEVPSKPPSKVRVTFYESQKPNYVSSPESPDDLDILPIMSTPSPSQDKPGYIRQESAESGMDNPFRPDGDLSKEADEIVEMIKEGKPIVGTPNRNIEDIMDTGSGDASPNGKKSPAGSPIGNGPGTKGLHSSPNNVSAATVDEPLISPSKANAVYASSPGSKSGVNGTAPTTAVTPESIEVQHGIVVPPNDASHVEVVNIKKKPNCKCCVVM